MNQNLETDCVYIQNISDVIIVLIKMERNNKNCPIHPNEVKQFTYSKLNSKHKPFDCVTCLVENSSQQFDHFNKHRDASLEEVYNKF